MSVWLMDQQSLVLPTRHLPPPPPPSSHRPGSYLSWEECDSSSNLCRRLCCKTLLAVCSARGWKRLRCRSVLIHTMRFGSTAKVLLKCKLKYYRISECAALLQIGPAELDHAVGARRPGHGACLTTSKQLGSTRAQELRTIMRPIVYFAMESFFCAVLHQ